jgi:DNA-directed RNA polymerase subunit M/transcription elongation factor TFIIS
MPDYQKRIISVSPNERRELEEAKRRYEERHGSTDWGGFLSAMVGLGLAAAGIYALAKVLQRSDKSAEVSCPACGKSFVMALPARTRGEPPVLEVNCPECNAELVVDLVPRKTPERKRK